MEMSIEELVKYQDPETHRREQPSLDAVPLDPVKWPGIDYGSAGTKMDKAMAHLDGGLPGGQKVRCEKAYRLLKQGFEELTAYMKAKGYEIE